MTNRTYKPGDEVMINYGEIIAVDDGDLLVRFGTAFSRIELWMKPDQLLPLSSHRDAIADAAIAASRSFHQYNAHPNRATDEARAICNSYENARSLRNNLIDAYLSGAAK